MADGRRDRTSSPEPGREVTYFLYLDGTLVPVVDQSFPACSDGGLFDELPAEKFRSLVAAGATVICCGLCVDACGIDAESAYPAGVEVGLLPDLADMLGEADRVVSL